MTVRSTSPNQMTLDFEPGLTDRYSSLLDCVRQSIYTHRNPMKTVAADMDLSASELSRKLADNPNDTRRFSVDDLELYLEKGGDMTPIFYLIEKYLADEETKQRRAFNELSKHLPQFLALIKQVLGKSL